MIFAGGFATRMRPLTNDLPKYLLPVAGAPFAHHQLTLLRSQGFSDVVLCIGHLGDQIREFVGDGGQWGLRVRYSDEGSVQQGTRSALVRALPLLAAEFATVYGDSYLTVDPNLSRLVFESLGCDVLTATWDGIDYGLSWWKRSAVGTATVRRMFPVAEPWREIGSVEGLRGLDEFLRGQVRQGDTSAAEAG